MKHKGAKCVSVVSRTDTCNKPDWKGFKQNYTEWKTAVVEVKWAPASERSPLSCSSSTLNSFIFFPQSNNSVHQIYSSSWVWVCAWTQLSTPPLFYMAFKYCKWAILWYLLLLYCMYMQYAWNILTGIIINTGSVHEQRNNKLYFSQHLILV